MSSLRLSTSLQQRMVLTPQLRQRIEMLQMNSIELTELVEQELVANPVLEEVQPGDEVKEIGDSILDQNAAGEDGDFADEATFSAEKTERLNAVGEEFDSYSAEDPSLNGAGEEPVADREFSEESDGERSDAFLKRSITAGEFQDYLDPDTNTRN